ncbi:hypothetical protein CMEL01_04256 [Colletotrichum melonis]|uniref:Uncharacterized protein n=1 Tax=Colletotrichum melonis TaxID=1209925 RepID=A0AAI9UBX1_9PEZI|nr:hypothetical protein CMEL01_04256 [Colletotrichum melonis]
MQSRARSGKIHTTLVELSKYGLDDFLEGPEAFDIYFKTYASIAGVRVLLEYAGRRRYQSFPFRKRLQHFRTIVWRVPDGRLSLDELHFLLPETKNLTIDDLVLSRSTGYCSLFHSLAYGLVRQTAKWSTIGPEPMTQIPWCGLLRTCLQLDPAGLYHLEEAELPHYAIAEFQTPFSFLIDNAYRLFLFTPSGTWTSFLQQSQRGMSAWLDVLTLNGTDLLDYGRKERRLHDEGLIFRHAYHVYSDLSLRVRLLGITYGKSKDDWRFWWVDEYEHYVGDFWEMVHQVDLDVKVPGSWVDECDYDQHSPYREERPRGKWFSEERMPLIWSEHREVKAPL